MYKIYLFTECTTTVPYLKVYSTSSNYQDTGVFKCEDGYYLKHLITNEQSLNTECLYDASWSNESLFDCWGGIFDKY